VRPLLLLQELRAREARRVASDDAPILHSRDAERREAVAGPKRRSQTLAAGHRRAPAIGMGCSLVLDRKGPLWLNWARFPVDPGLCVAVAVCCGFFLLEKYFSF
jgi:hypothetical protein